MKKEKLSLDQRAEDYLVIDGRLGIYKETPYSYCINFGDLTKPGIQGHVGDVTIYFDHKGEQPNPDPQSLSIAVDRERPIEKIIPSWNGIQIRIPPKPTE